MIDAVPPALIFIAGDVTVVEFFDYQCGYCKQLFADLMATVNADKNVKLVLKEYPVLGDNSELASKAALAAQRQGKYVELHQALMSASGKLTADRIEAIASGVGIDIDKMHEDMADPQLASLISHNRDLAHELGINGTPSFVVNDEVYYGYLDAEAMKKVIDDARSRAADAKAG